MCKNLFFLNAAFGNLIPPFRRSYSCFFHIIFFVVTPVFLRRDLIACAYLLRFGLSFLVNILLRVSIALSRATAFLLSALLLAGIG